VWFVSIGLVCYLSLSPDVATPFHFRWADKVYHSIAYLWLSFLPFLAIRRTPVALGAVSFIMLLGLGLELAQNYVPGRFSSVGDMIANSLGVGLGVFLGLYILGTRKAA
jgi:VanZ family protein